MFAVKTEIESQKFPSVELTYPLALKSYEWAARRLDSMDSRIQAILGLGMTLTLAAPIAFAALELKINHEWFIGAVCFFVSALVVGTIARLKGALTVLTPKTLYEKYLGFSEWEFKKNLIFFAGQHLDKNKLLIYRKHQLLITVTALFFLEILCLVASVSFRL